MFFISSPPPCSVWKKKELSESSSQPRWRRQPEKPRLTVVKQRGNDSSASWRAGEKHDKKIEPELDLPSREFRRFLQTNEQEVNRSSVIG